MSHVSASFSATLRVRLSDRPGSFARLAQAVNAGGSLGAIDLVRVEGATKIRHVTVDASGTEHLEQIVEAVRAIDGIEVERVSDRTFLMHLGGKIEMRSKVPVKTRDDLSMAYHPARGRRATGRCLRGGDQAERARPEYVIPSVFNRDVAAAVAEAAERAGVARRSRMNNGVRDRLQSVPYAVSCT